MRGARDSLKTCLTPTSPVCTVAIYLEVCPPPPWGVDGWVGLRESVGGLGPGGKVPLQWGGGPRS